MPAPDQELFISVVVRRRAFAVPEQAPDVTRLADLILAEVKRQGYDAGADAGQRPFPHAPFSLQAKPSRYRPTRFSGAPVARARAKWIWLLLGFLCLCGSVASFLLWAHK